MSMLSFLRICKLLHEKPDLEPARLERVGHAIMRRIHDPQLMPKPAPVWNPFWALKNLAPQYGMAAALLLLLGGFVGSIMPFAVQQDYTDAPSMVMTDAPSMVMAAMDSPWSSLWQNEEL